MNTNLMGEESSDDFWCEKCNFRAPRKNPRTDGLIEAYKCACGHAWITK